LSVQDESYQQIRVAQKSRDFVPLLGLRFAGCVFQ
jgi:hypothetical protein